MDRAPGGLQDVIKQIMAVGGSDYEVIAKKPMTDLLSETACPTRGMQSGSGVAIARYFNITTK